jgi:hypothetical protein
MQDGVDRRIPPIASLSGQSEFRKEKTVKCRSLALALAAGLLAISAAAPVSAAPSCAGQFASAVAANAVPFGQNFVVAEVRNLSFGGPNLGQEVKILFATADRTACPVTP